MNFSTIIQKNIIHPLIFHCTVLEKHDGYFKVEILRDLGKREIWDCHYDFWDLIEDGYKTFKMEVL